MERDRPFSFKLLLPPRTKSGPLNAVKPQEFSMDSTCDIVAASQGHNKGLDKESSLLYPSTNMVISTKSIKTDAAKRVAVSPVEREETTLTSRQLYSKLLEEAEKIKSWKLKTDSDISQKDRTLQENKRTIETQRKAIQELQFGNESLSMKLEDQIHENEELQNKNNAAWNLCNILKETFERSAEKMNLFESEREETHHLFMQNHNEIQRMTTAFEQLCLQAEAEHQEMVKVREDLQIFEDLKIKLENEINMKQEKVAMLQTKLSDKDNELSKILLKLQEAQESCSRLHETINQLWEESKNVQNKHKEELKKLQDEVLTKSTSEAQLNEESQYDKLVQEKDAELDEKRRKEAEMLTSKTSLAQLEQEIVTLKKQINVPRKDKIQQVLC
ncbi:synaptonemal complex protein 1 [Chanos chanos]|uniref:Synaptonemal complex protein 1 n=1 Tax=Chanos chanos TaxID=29144 RepID=A0A6J2VPN7_CHACN|nr:synaptonemal complex protein 1 [Chanos chanos]